MTNISESVVWAALRYHHEAIKSDYLLDWFKRDPTRFKRFSCNAAGLLLDYSKNRITAETVDLLLSLADTCNLKQKINDLFSGKPLNFTEARPALHTALRQELQQPLVLDGRDIMQDIKAVQQHMEVFCQRHHSQQWVGFLGKPMVDIVNMGIGGSDLGAKCVVEALHAYRVSRLKFHFVSNMDSAQWYSLVGTLNPETTLFIIASKSFTTQETLINAGLAKRWLMQAGCSEAKLALHWVAVTANRPEAQAFGIPAGNIFDLWDWVGGRYSLWSAIGLPIALSVGMAGFKALLAGARSMDKHFLTAPFTENMPVIMALLSVWYNNFFQASTHAVLPYAYALSSLVPFLQQLTMESLGKMHRSTGERTDYATGPILWGGVGSNGQHAFHQLLLQGQRLIPCDFIVSLCAAEGCNTPQHEWLVAQCFAQAQAFMQGYPASTTRSYCEVPGNQPSNLLLLSELSPETLGALMALYEHKTFVQAMIWDINPFDQWGVELGKRLTQPIHQAMTTEASLESFDSSTRELIQYYLSHRR